MTSPMRAGRCSAGCVVLAVTMVCAAPSLRGQRLVGIGGGPQQPSAGDPSQPAAQPLPSGAPRLSRDIQIDGTSIWTDANLNLRPGERLIFTADGSLRCPGQQLDNGPNGLQR